MAANDRQEGGSHYQTTIQPWDYITANNLGYLEGNIVKYISRYKSKNGLEDLRKAQHYLTKLIEVTYDNSPKQESRSPKTTRPRTSAKHDTVSETPKRKRGRPRSSAAPKGRNKSPAKSRI